MQILRQSLLRKIAAKQARTECGGVCDQTAERFPSFAEGARRHNSTRNRRRFKLRPPSSTPPPLPTKSRSLLDF